MPTSTIYDYVHPTKGNLIKGWSEGLQKKELAKLNSRIDALELHGKDLIPGLLAPTGVPNVFKLRARGQVALRPMVCEGPGLACFTLLMGAKEIQGKYDPPNAPEMAASYRNDLMANPERRRILHERVTGKTP